MDRLAHFHFIIIFSSHRWSSASFCYVRSLALPLSAESRPLLPSSVPPSPSLPPGINTHGGTGRAGGATPKSSMSPEWNSRPGKKLRNAKYYCPGPASVPSLALPTVDNTPSSSLSPTSPTSSANRKSSIFRFENFENIMYRLDTSIDPSMKFQYNY